MLKKLITILTSTKDKRCTTKRTTNILEKNTLKISFIK